MTRQYTLETDDFELIKELEKITTSGKYNYKLITTEEVMDKLYPEKPQLLNEEPNYEEFSYAGLTKISP